MNKKIGIIDNDNTFLKRFSQVMQTRHPDIEILTFPDFKSAKTAAENSLLNLLLVDETACTNQSVFSIPAPCRVAIMRNGRENTGDENLPTVCKYQSVEEWYSVICGLCGSEGPYADEGGGVASSDTVSAAVCLFLPGCDGNGAVLAATEFCRFLAENELGRTATFEPRFESGEDLWRATEHLIPCTDYLCICMNNWNNDSVVIPVLNAAFVVLVTDGSRSSNERIRKLLRDLPRITGEPKDYILKKTALMYNGFDPESGELIKNSELTKLGGLDSARNSKAAFEKLVALCTKR